MSVVVRSVTRPSISVVQGSQGSGSAVVVRKTGDLTVQGLSNVVSTDLQDGYTLIYDSETGKWVTQSVDNINVTAVDGGTY
jgi:hypothetical protein